MILTGVLAPGQRIVETEMAELLSVSRTPVRNALPALAKEGLLRPRGRRGFSVQSFSAADSIVALSLRGVLEGFAARMIAVRGMPIELRTTLEGCLSDGDVIFTKGYLTEADEHIYAGVNARFHSAIAHGANAPVVTDMISRVNLIPFVAPGALAFDKIGLARAFEVLMYAHRQHHAIIDAILSGDGTRAEFHFREHSHTQRLAMWNERGPGNL